MNELARVVEALLFLSAEPVSVERLAEACEVSEGEVVEALARLRGRIAQLSRPQKPPTSAAAASSRSRGGHPL